MWDLNRNSLLWEDKNLRTWIGGLGTMPGVQTSEGTDRKSSGRYEQPSTGVGRL